MRRGSWLSLLALVGCAACRDASPPAPSPGDLRSVRFARDAQKGALAPVRETLRRSLSKPGRLQVLALSGGGQWGAFGAGFLKGWTRHGDRPAEFQVVTGTSTGALQATFAFLGRDFDDAWDASTSTSGATPT